ncbi:hypothetical protein [Hoyosella altamirensis]|uniref:Acid stress chaperone HdeA n=1 Tax=Hoyosella altamirensis TaxID=616997 RepID=A0A839RPP4_9ACTN|nr:hypothetical protein [Hoyosella altamirensis]MBB3038367.1 acid stress chaperone HdeA [Hoyosella altamirensis]
MTASRRIRTAFVAATAAAALVLSGCGDDTDVEDTIGDFTEEVGDVFRTGGDTTCREFSEQDPDEQRSTVEDFLAEEEEGEPTDAQIEGASLAVMALCAIEGNDETPIRDADLQP